MVRCSPTVPCVSANETAVIATFGAVLFAQQPKEVGLIVKAGHDFPTALEETFHQWKVDLHILRQQERPSARGRVLYGQDASQRTYQRVTQPMPSTPEDLDSTNLILAWCFHFFDTPSALSDQIKKITDLRFRQGIQECPVYVWEPQAKSCSPETFESHKAMVREVDIFSPNHAELALFFPRPDGDTPLFDKRTVEQQARAFVPEPPSEGLSRPLCILIRCAEHGCFVLSSSPNAQQSAWLPPYHGSESSGVIDPTGAGNAFLGGAAMGYLEHRDFIKAAAYGSVAASFAVEVVGLPDIRRCDSRARLEEYVGRLELPVTGLISRS